MKSPCDFIQKNRVENLDFVWKKGETLLKKKKSIVMSGEEKYYDK